MTCRDWCNEYQIAIDICVSIGLIECFIEKKSLIDCAQPLSARLSTVSYRIVDSAELADMQNILRASWSAACYSNTNEKYFHTFDLAISFGFSVNNSGYFLDDFKFASASHINSLCSINGFIIWQASLLEKPVNFKLDDDGTRKLQHSGMRFKALAL